MGIRSIWKSDTRIQLPFSVPVKTKTWYESALQINKSTGGVCDHCFVARHTLRPPSNIWFHTLLCTGEMFALCVQELLCLVRTSRLKMFWIRRPLDRDGHFYLLVSQGVPEVLGHPLSGWALCALVSFSNNFIPGHKYTSWRYSFVEKRLS